MDDMIRAAAISDLFFNRDFSHVKTVDEKNRFIGYNLDALTAEAATFIESMKVLGVDAGTTESVVADFLKRV